MAFLLDKQGLLLTLIFGVVIFLAGGLQYLETILAFFLFALIVTKYEHDAKRKLGLYEHERSWENVLSNGLLPMILAILSPSIGFVPYLSAIAAITADKFSSEIGVLSGNAIALETLKPIKAGRSGAISPLGTLASLVGGTLIGVVGVFIFQITPTNALFIGSIGVIGSFIDSVFGVLEDRGIGNKATTNFICSLSGALLGYFLIRI